MQNIAPFFAIVVPGVADATMGGRQGSAVATMLMECLSKPLQLGMVLGIFIERCPYKLPTLSFQEMLRRHASNGLAIRRDAWVNVTTSR
jgi:hypothetical protein